MAEEKQEKSDGGFKEFTDRLKAIEDHLGIKPKDTRTPKEKLQAKLESRKRS